MLIIHQIYRIITSNLLLLEGMTSSIVLCYNINKLTRSLTYLLTFALLLLLLLMVLLAFSLAQLVFISRVTSTLTLAKSPKRETLSVVRAGFYRQPKHWTENVDKPLLHWFAAYTCLVIAVILSHFCGVSHLRRLGLHFTDNSRDAVVCMWIG